MVESAAAQVMAEEISGDGGVVLATNKVTLAVCFHTLVGPCRATRYLSQPTVHSGGRTLKSSVAAGDEQAAPHICSLIT